MNDSSRTIVLVGNARSLLVRSTLGAVIDTFPIVVRFNNFMTAGYETCVGTKTDWWARNETPDVLPRTERFAKILLRLQGEEPDLYYRGGAELLPKLKNDYPNTAIEVIPRAVFTELIAECQFARGPLTGTLIIAYLLRIYPCVHVCGFDNLTGPPETLRHYYSDENIIGDWTTYHEPDKEAAYLQRLIQQERIVPI